MVEPNQIPIITIDGPGGTGKGTLALQLTRWLGWNFLDSGALYRALGLLVLEQQIVLSNGEKIVEVASKMDVRFDDDGSENMVFLDGSDVTNSIRTEECGAFASKLAASRLVRGTLLKRQRNFLSLPGLIADGRDMGTTVFPDANLKIYLTASIEERAQRRHKQLKQKGITARLARLSEDIRLRDDRDRQRQESPMKPASDAEIVDTTGLPIAEVERLARQLVKSRFGELLAL